MLVFEVLLSIDYWTLIDYWTIDHDYWSIDYRRRANVGPILIIVNCWSVSNIIRIL